MSLIETIDRDPFASAMKQMTAKTLTYLSTLLPLYPLDYRQYPASISFQLKINRDELIADTKDKPGWALAFTVWQLVSVLINTGGEITGFGYYLDRPNDVPLVEFQVGVGKVSDGYTTDTCVTVSVNPAIDFRSLYEWAENDGEEWAQDACNAIHEALVKHRSEEAWDNLVDRVLDPDPTDA